MMITSAPGSLSRVSPGRTGVALVIMLVGVALTGCARQAPAPATPAAAAPPTTAAPAPAPAPAMVRVPAGRVTLLYARDPSARTQDVPAFEMATRPVTNAEFLSFVQANPSWRRSQISSLYADASYLAEWSGDLDVPAGLMDVPVTSVSWFAARAYAAWIGQRLPTLVEWERALAPAELMTAAEVAELETRILAWYAAPTGASLARVASRPANCLGLHDLDGLVWEWVEDFTSVLLTGESRGDGALERSLFCGAGSTGAEDPSAYAAFMRFAFRASLKGRYCLRNLGFRTARDLVDSKERP